MTAERDVRMRPRVVVFDECQEMFRHETLGKEAKELAIKVMMKARKCGITLVFVTPAPSADSLPRDLAKTAPVPVALPAPCWWIDRGDCWEITHHPSSEDAEADHADRVRSDYGWVLSVAGAFAIVPGVARQEPRRCWEITCPECGTAQHIQGRFESCVDECGYEIEIEQISTDDPAQTRFFEVLPTHDIEGQPLSLVVVFAEEDPRRPAPSPPPRSWRSPCGRPGRTGWHWGIKNVENRTWAPPGGWRGQLVIHAGKTLDLDGFRYLAVADLADVHRAGPDPDIEPAVSSGDEPPARARTSSGEGGTDDVRRQEQEQCPARARPGRRGAGTDRVRPDRRAGVVPDLRSPGPVGARSGVQAGVVPRPLPRPVRGVTGMRVGSRCLRCKRPIELPRTGAAPVVCGRLRCRLGCRGRGGGGWS